MRLAGRQQLVEGRPAGRRERQVAVPAEVAAALQPLDQRASRPAGTSSEAASAPGAIGSRSASRASTQLSCGAMSMPESAISSSYICRRPSRRTSVPTSRSSSRSELSSRGEANDSATPSAAAVWRSGTSCSSQVSRNARIEIPAAARNTGCRADEKLSTYGRWIAGGSWARTAGLAAVGTFRRDGRREAARPPGGSRRSPRTAGRRSSRRPARNSVEPDVATPSSLYLTAFWTASTSTCITMPSPRPRISM